eukprot:7050507-Prymnesium_polylepis.1
MAPKMAAATHAPIRRPRAQWRQGGECGQRATQRSRGRVLAAHQWHLASSCRRRSSQMRQGPQLARALSRPVACGRVAKSS